MFSVPTSVPERGPITSGRQPTPTKRTNENGPRSFHGASACLRALFAAGRYDELIELVRGDIFWPDKRWAVKAMVAQGQHAEAIAFAGSCRNPWASDQDIDGVCERILLSTGRMDEAYSCYALMANRTHTYLAWFRAVTKKYPDEPRSGVLLDLVQLTPGDEGKWFAAAKDAKLFGEAVALANRTPCDPKTLTRAARDFAEKNPALPSRRASRPFGGSSYGCAHLAAAPRCHVKRRRPTLGRVLCASV